MGIVHHVDPKRKAQIWKRLNIGAEKKMGVGIVEVIHAI
tara:strand:+ start:230 stop:346 length:117 start_codon:yes stop_codon:yes gene_type:complete